MKVLEIYSERLLRGQEDEIDITKKLPASAVNEVESDLEADPPSPRPERPSPSTSSSPYPSPVTRFHAIRSSLQITPRPVQPAPRESMNYTFDEAQENENALTTAYLKSLRNFRVKPGKPEWTDQQKKACLLFEKCRSTVNQNDVKKRIEEAGIALTEEQCHRIYNKIKTAIQVFKKK